MCLTPGFDAVLIWGSTPTLFLSLEQVPPLISQPEREISITVAKEFRPDVSEAWLEGALAAALDFALLPHEPPQVSLALTDDATVRNLNREYRGLDEVTDVLSFSATHAGQWEGEEAPSAGPAAFLGLDGEETLPGFVLPPDELPPLGEIIVSYPQTCRQAVAQGKPVEHELALLIAHGALHLVGHDHVEPEETAAMQALERRALARIFGDGEYAP